MFPMPVRCLHQSSPTEEVSDSRSVAGAKSGKRSGAHRGSVWRRGAWSWRPAARRAALPSAKLADQHVHRRCDCRRRSSFAAWGLVLAASLLHRSAAARRSGRASYAASLSRRRRAPTRVSEHLRRWSPSRPSLGSAMGPAPAISIAEVDLRGRLVASRSPGRPDFGSEVRASKARSWTQIHTYSRRRSMRGSGWGWPAQTPACSQ